MEFLRLQPAARSKPPKPTLRVSVGDQSMPIHDRWWSVGRKKKKQVYRKPGICIKKCFIIGSSKFWGSLSSSMSDRLLASPTCQVISAAVLFATVPSPLDWTQPLQHRWQALPGWNPLRTDQHFFTMRGRERGESDEGRGAGGGLEVRVT